MVSTWPPCSLESIQLPVWENRPLWSIQINLEIRRESWGEFVEQHASNPTTRGSSSAISNPPMGILLWIQPTKLSRADQNLQTISVPVVADNLHVKILFSVLSIL